MKVDRYLETTKEQRKMARAVAKDVLLQLENKMFIVDGGYYLDYPASVMYGDDIKTANPEIIKNCRVCAKGAMFVSRALLFNEYKFGDSVSYRVGDDFGRLNSDLIEGAFETCTPASGNDTGLRDSAIKFGKKYKNQRNRLKAIMQNVLDNGGVFRPDKPKKATS